MRDLNVELDRLSFVRFYVNMNCLLNDMVRRPGEVGLEEGGPSLGRVVFSGKDADLRIDCRARGVRPFILSMDRPWPAKFFLGRVTGEGRPRIFLYGLKLFYDALKAEGALEAFGRELERSLDERLAAKRPPLQ